jgi:hypothetical protein
LECKDSDIRRKDCISSEFILPEITKHKFHHSVFREGRGEQTGEAYGAQRRATATVVSATRFQGAAREGKEQREKGKDNKQRES